ncbi:hypothetical protein ACFQ1S_19090, partial [Kibdelosporangium lantanae]
RAIAPDGVDVIVEVALSTNLDLDLAVLRFRGTIATYANDGDAPVNLNVRRNMVINTRFQFVVLYTAGLRCVRRRWRTSPRPSVTERCLSARNMACRCSVSRSTAQPRYTALWRLARSARS